MAENTPIRAIQNARLSNELHCLGPRRYTTAIRIDRIANYYYQKTGNGITFAHLIKEGVSTTKRQAQNTLKRFRSRGILFTLENRRPQIYYPTSNQSEILQTRLKNEPIDATGVHKNKTCNLSSYDIVNETLEGFVLPLLPKAPLSIHNMHFKLHIKNYPDTYKDLSLPVYRKNGGKYYDKIVSGFLVRAVIYPKGTIVIETSSSNNPFKLVDDSDLAHLFVFIGEIKGFIKDILKDDHDRIVPNVMQWQMTELDINKDIVIGHAFHMTGLRIQLKHLNHLIRIYFKALGRDTICRVEENIVPKTSAIETITKIFDLNDKSSKGEVRYDDIELNGE